MMRVPLRLPGKLRLPRQTVRLRLTLLYGGLVLLPRVGLLAVTYLLVSQATGNGDTYVGPSGQVNTYYGQAPPQDNGMITNSSGLSLQQQTQQAKLLANQAAQQHADLLRELLVQSGIALC